MGSRLGRHEYWWCVWRYPVQYLERQSRCRCHERNRPQHWKRPFHQSAKKFAFHSQKVSCCRRATSWGLRKGRNSNMPPNKGFRRTNTDKKRSIFWNAHAESYAEMKRLSMARVHADRVQANADQVICTWNWDQLEWRFDMNRAACDFLVRNEVGVRRRRPGYHTYIGTHCR